ncbi:MAG: hypothetical protein R8G33_00020 [Gammaproteobacteria bacterium]|nr:hypothetical protein [Gammaproteobacteria bacterium]
MRKVMGNSNSQIDNTKSTNEQKNKFKDIEDAIQKAIDNEKLQTSSCQNKTKKLAHK